MGKGSTRRPENEKAVRSRWPFDDPGKLYKKHRAELARRQKEAEVKR